jgi:septum formation protein
VSPSALLLASGSPVRRRLLAQAGYAFRVVPARVEEVLVEDIPPAEAAAALALCKAHDVLGRHPGAHVIGADQVLVLPGGSVAGKTATREAARARIRELAGRVHTLVTAAAVVSSTAEDVVTDQALVRFRPLSKDQVERYLDLEEWWGTAGSYLLESRGIHLVDSVQGDLFTVLGLPLFPLVPVLERHGWSPL